MAGKSGGTTVQTAQLTPEQRAEIAARVNFFTGTIAPAYQEAVLGAKDIYNTGAQGVNRAAQNLAATAGQAQSVLGGTGESALRTGISGLQNLFSEDYERKQIEAAMAPAQQQYATNLANQRAQFGGAGQLGSARAALADTALAGSTAAQQQATAAKIASDIAAQRLQASSSLANLGQGGLGQAIGAAQQGVGAAMTDQDFYNKYASLIFGTPATSYSGNFQGSQGYTKTDRNYQVGIGGPFGTTPL